MDNNLIELANLMFKGEAKPPYSIQMELNDYECLEDLFEVLLHLFIYGFKIRELSVHEINSLKEYFSAIGVNFNVEVIPYSEYEFLTNHKYLSRYCNVASSSFEDYDMNNLQFVLSRNYKSVNLIDNMYACYVHEIPNDFNNSFICFINFNYKLNV